MESDTEQEQGASDAPSGQVTHTRTVTVPSTGAKACLLLGVLLLVAAGYFLLVPIQIHPGGGSAFDCGTALNGPASRFGKGLCGSVNQAYAARAAALAVAGLALACGGFLVFGTIKRTRSRTTGE